MNFRGFRIHVILVVVVTVIAIGLVLQYVHQHTQVIDPLIGELQEIPGVAEVTLDKAVFSMGSRMNVELHTEPDAHLGAVFTSVHQVLADAGGDFALYVHDSANESLVRMFERMRISVEEAIITGEFTALESRVQNLAASAGVDWELSLDRDFIYLSLLEGDSVLRRVIHRDFSEGKIVVYTSGGADNWVTG